MLFEAAGLLSDNPKLKLGEAAEKVASRVVAENDWRGREPVSEAGLTSWIRGELKHRQPQMKRAQAERELAEETLSRPIFASSRKRRREK